MAQLTTFSHDQIIFKNFIIDYSKKYANKISLWDSKRDFYGDYYFIMEAKKAIIKGDLTNISALCRNMRK